MSSFPIFFLFSHLSKEHLNEIYRAQKWFLVKGKDNEVGVKEERGVRKACKLERGGKQWYGRKLKLYKGGRNHLAFTCDV